MADLRGMKRKREEEEDRGLVSRRQLNPLEASRRTRAQHDSSTRLSKAECALFRTTPPCEPRASCLRRSPGKPRQIPSNCPAYDGDSTGRDLRDANAVISLFGDDVGRLLVPPSLVPRMIAEQATTNQAFVALGVGCVSLTVRLCDATPYRIQLASRGSRPLAGNGFRIRGRLRDKRPRFKTKNDGDGDLGDEDQGHTTSLKTSRHKTHVGRSKDVCCVS